VNQPLSDSQKWQSLKVINLALMSGASMFLGVVIFISLSKEPASNFKEGYAVFASIVGCIWLGSLVVKSQLSRVFEKKLTEENPFPAYQNLVIIRMALSEGPALFGLVALFLFAPGAEASSYPRLAVFLLPFLSLLVTGLVTRPSEADLKERVRIAKENQSFRK
jgi:hypothetical protein